MRSCVTLFQTFFFSFSWFIYFSFRKWSSKSIVAINSRLTRWNSADCCVRLLLPLQSARLLSCCTTLPIRCVSTQCWQNQHRITFNHNDRIDKTSLTCSRWNWKKIFNLKKNILIRINDFKWKWIFRSLNFKFKLAAVGIETGPLLWLAVTLTTRLG